MRVSALKAGLSNRIQANNNPINLRDPSGRQPFPPGIGPMPPESIEPIVNEGPAFEYITVEIGTALETILPAAESGGSVYIPPAVAEAAGATLGGLLRRSIPLILWPIMIGGDDIMPPDCKKR